MGWEGRKGPEKTNGYLILEQQEPVWDLSLRNQAQDLSILRPRAPRQRPSGHFERTARSCPGTLEAGRWEWKSEERRMREWWSGQRRSAESGPGAGWRQRRDGVEAGEEATRRAPRTPHSRHPCCQRGDGRVRVPPAVFQPREPTRDLESTRIPATAAGDPAR